MALFEYFPNYIWNLPLSITMESGAQIGEIIDRCKPICHAAADGADNMTYARDYIADGFAETLGGKAA